MPPPRTGTPRTSGPAPIGTADRNLRAPAMLSFAIRRILYAIPILLGVSVVVFGLMQLAPGDVTDILIPPEAPREVADLLRAKLGLDKPVHIQYLFWVGSILQGDLGI